VEEWKKVEVLLTVPELDLFKQLPVPDQNHSLRVLSSLEANGETDPDLLKAALLHDIGKISHPLQRWERVFAVLLGGGFPGIAAAWGQKDPRGIHRPLVVTNQHPIWGADLVEQAGSSQRVIWLVRHHEEEDLTGLFDQGGVELLQKLQKADNLN
jgi:putative nucleotidyltransferase with HDIG domain